MTRHLLADDGLTAAEQSQLLDVAAALKADRALGRGALAGRAVALVFEKPSTRTRMSFEVGVAQLGGHPVVIDAQTTQLGRGETVEDTARVMSRYVDAIVIRTSGDDRLAAFADAADVPVVNALTDGFHPCQILADLLTVREHVGAPAGRVLTYLGDAANNMARSYALGGALAGLHVRLSGPAGYLPDEELLARARAVAAATGGSVEVRTDPAEAARGADILCTDVWLSMGQDGAERRRADLAAHALDEAALALAAPGAVVLHCLPAHRGEEISAAVLDGPASRVWDEAENRLHAQKALLCLLLGVTP